ncbi:MAG TPA: endospore germination permease [Spirochaetales bacterium]|nr:endospore germination permease [Spirochaetales bacterium]
MMEKAKISGIQLSLLFTGFLFGSVIIMNPAISAKNDAWLSIILGGFGGTLLIWIYASIALLNPSKTLVEILQEKLGKILGNTIAILYIWYFIHLASLVFRNFGEFIATVTFPETPMVVVLVIFALILVYSINSGIEVMGRLSELFVPIIPVVAIMVAFALITIHDFSAFMPIMENGIGPVLKAAIEFITFPNGETVVFLMLFPHLNKKENLKKATMLSVLAFIILSLFIFFRDISVLGSDLMFRATFANHLTSLLIPGINVEPLIDINLLIGGGIKISVCIYAAVKALSQVLGISDYRILTAAVTTFCVVLSIWVYENVLEMFSWAEKVWPYYSIPFQIVIPLLLFFLSLRKKFEPSNAKTES